MSNAIVRTSTAKRRTFDAISAAKQDRAFDAKADALVAELRKVRDNVDTLLRASELAQLKSTRTAA